MLRFGESPAKPVDSGGQLDNGCFVADPKAHTAQRPAFGPAGPPKESRVK